MKHKPERKVVHPTTGVTKTVAQWAAEIGITKNTFSQRLYKRGESDESVFCKTVAKAPAVEVVITEHKTVAAPKKYKRMSKVQFNRMVKNWGQNE